MASEHRSSDSENEEFHSLASPNRDGDVDETQSFVMEPPVHPIPTMQGAFEESIVESVESEERTKSTAERSFRNGANARIVFEVDQHKETTEARPGRKSRVQHHPFHKLIAQLVFGLHLLQRQQAKSDDEVVKILMVHVSQVDGFLERTSQDFDLAIKDIHERIHHLRLPMKHMKVFDTMLENKTFRADLVRGNEKIEKIVRRTERGMNVAMCGVRIGIRATQELGQFLTNIHGQWPAERADIAEIFESMSRNEKGWSLYLRTLRTQGNSLRNDLLVLRTILDEISRLSEAVIKNTKLDSTGKPSSASPQRAISAPTLESKLSNSSSSETKNNLSLNKPLPQAPRSTSDPAHLAKLEARSKPVDLRSEQSRSQPAPRSTRESKTPSSATRPTRRQGSRGNSGTHGDPQTPSKKAIAELEGLLKPSQPSLDKFPFATSDHSSQSRVEGKVAQQDVQRQRVKGDTSPSKNEKFLVTPPMIERITAMQNQAHSNNMSNQSVGPGPPTIEHRLNTMPLPPPEQAPVELDSRPIDSVHSASPERKKSDTASPKPDVVGPSVETSPQPMYHLRLFPKDLRPLTIANDQNLLNEPNLSEAKGVTLVTKSPVLAASETRVTRTLSFRTVFRRKQRPQTLT